MKNTLILRKDIKINTNRLVRISVMTGAMLKDDIMKLDVLETVSVKELHDLEEKCIERGVLFNWVEDGKTICGIVVFKQETHKELLSSYKTYDPDIVTNNLGIK